MVFLGTMGKFVFSFHSLTILESAQDHYRLCNQFFAAFSIVVAAVESGHVGLMKCDDENPFHIYAGGPISKMRHSKTFHNIIGTGGLENELKLWDLNTGKNTFTAKNVSIPCDSH